MRFLSLAVLIVLSACRAPSGAPAPGDPLASDPLAAALDSTLARIVEGPVVGAVLLVALDGELVYHEAAGWADREGAVPVTEATVFRLASVSKPVVALAALALVERGALSLDDPVSRWLPEVRFRLASGAPADPTVRHLLTHTAGLEYRFDQPPGGAHARASVSTGLDDVRVTLDENLRRLATVPLDAAPGQAWAYSMATDVLGAVVAAAAGEPLPEAVRELVTGPLGAPSLAFAASGGARLATAYADAPEGGLPVRMGDPHTVPYGDGAGIVYSPGRAFRSDAYPSGGAGMVGSARDVLRVLEEVRTGGTAISAETAALARRNHVGRLAEPTLGPGVGWGFVGQVVVDPEAAGSPHSAGTVAWGGAYGHSWFVDPARGLTVVLVTNTALAGMRGAVPTAVRDAVYASLPSGAARLGPGTGARRPPRR